jgi:hypothetical protein
LLRRSDSSAECGQQGLFACSYARSEKTDSGGSARSRSQTAFPELFPATASVGPPSGPISGSWHILSAGFALADGGPAFSCVGVAGVGLRRYSLSEAGFATRSRKI